MPASSYLVIVGCGRLGGALANRLSKAGHEIVVIDQRAAAFDKLSGDFSGIKLIGDAAELHILKEANVGVAEYLFATTTSDNTNLMVAQIARTIFQVPRAVARVFDPTREEIYRGLGIETISPTKLSTDAFLSILD